MSIVLAFIRETALLSDELIQSYMASQQIQITRDFAPIWGVDATCVFVKGGDIVPPGAWEVLFQDHSPDAGDLGYHTDDGAPRGYVFVADALADRVLWTVTGSHEVLELLADPNCTKTATVGDTEYAWEVCDACEDDVFAYAVQGHMLSDFVTPEWFDANSASSIYSFRDSVAAPFTLAAGGYIGVRTLPNGAWSQRMAYGDPGDRAVKKRPSSRTMRRFNAA